MKKILLIITCMLIMTGCTEEPKTETNDKLSMNKIEENISTLVVKDGKPFENKESVNVVVKRNGETHSFDIKTTTSSSGAGRRSVHRA